VLLKDSYVEIQTSVLQFFFSKMGEPPFFTVNYLVDNCSKHFDIPSSKFKQVVSHLLKFLY